MRKRMTVLSIVLLAVTLNGATPARSRGARASMPASLAKEIRIDNFSFGPASVTVTVGTSVTWVNHDDAPHKVVSTKDVFASTVLDTGGRFSYTFTKKGTYPYFCSIHPMMTATVIVK